MLTGKYIPNTLSHLWMLSSGSLGPYHSYDRNIKMVKPNSIIKLDKTTWKIEETFEEIIFEPNNFTKSENLHMMKESIKKNFDKISIDVKNWLFLLFGR